MPYGYGYAFGLMTGGSIGNGLSISAPSAVLFADGDQPIELWDYEAHNLLNYSEDLSQATANQSTAISSGLWYNHNGAVLTSTSVQDNSAASTLWIANYNLSAISGETYVYEIDMTKDAGYNAVAMFAVANDGGFNQIYFDPADGAYEYYSENDALSNFEVDDNTTYWTLRFRFGPTASSLISLAVYPARGANQTLTNGTTALDSYIDATAQETLEITRVWAKVLSSPATYVESTGQSAGATASYGDIQFVDTQYDSGADSYKVTLSIGNGFDEGDMTLQTVSGLTFTPTTGGDGTADESMEFTGTLAACLAALRGISVDNVAPGAVDLDVLITHVATGRTASKTIEIGSVAALSGGTVNNNIASGTTLENVTSLPGATYEIINYTPTLDEAAPTVTLSPLDNATDVAVDANMTMTFNQNVRFVVGGGTIVLREVGGSVLETFTPSGKTSAPGSAGGTCTITTTTVTINPNADLANSDEFEIIVSDGVIEDYNGNDYGGLATGEWSFTTVASGSPFDVSFLAATPDGTNYTTGDITFASQSFGSADTDRKIVVMVGMVGTFASSTAITNVDIAGVTATQVTGTYASTQVSPQDFIVGVYEAAVPTGTSGTITISVTTSGTIARMAIATYRVVNGTASAGTQTTAPNPSTSISRAPTIPSGGVGLFMGISNEFFAFGAPTNLDNEDFDTTIEGGQAGFNGGRRTTAGSSTVTLAIGTTGEAAMTACVYS